jgi:uncharacterized protein DUF6662
MSRRAGSSPGASARRRVLGWALALSLGSLGSAVPARAGEALFGYVYTTDLHPRGTWEFEQWATAALGKSRGDYNRFFQREELEYGVTDDFQLAAYVNWFHVTAERDGVDGTTSGPVVPEDVDPTRRYSATKFHSVSLEGIYRLLSPYKDPFGLALYVEPTIGPDIRELEGKLILQKNFLDDRLVWAANVSFAPEWERESGNHSLDAADPGSRRRWGKAIEVEFTTGLSYRLAPGWFAGLEFRNHNELEGHSLSHPEHSAFFLGPNVHFARGPVWVTLTVLPQLPLAATYTAEQRDERVGGKIFGDEHEQVEVRFRFGWTF